jgi:nitrogen fixation protein NifB
MKNPHPCFDSTARHTSSRVHLPVAPACNIQCHYCSRSFDCVNESRPGVTTKVLSPDQALWWLGRIRREIGDLSVVGIAGPGDPCANAEATLSTLRMVRARHPDVAMCLSTNGLALPDLVEPLAECGVSHLTVTVNAVDPGVAARIYRWVREGDDVLRGEDAARLLLARQAEGIRRAVAAGITVKLNSVVLPGINDQHLAEVAAAARDLGASFVNVIPLRPVEGTALYGLGAPPAAMLGEVRRRVSAILPVLSHCGQCRADAAGRIGAANSPAVTEQLTAAHAVGGAEAARPHVAVASFEGMFVNCHLGHARELLVYAETPEAFELVDVRPAPQPGAGEARWQELADLLRDCRAVVVSEAGPTPERALGARGIRVLCTEGLVEDALEEVFAGREDSLRPAACRSGGGCATAGRCGGGLGACA